MMYVPFAQRYTLKTTIVLPLRCDNGDNSDKTPVCAIEADSSVALVAIVAERGNPMSPAGDALTAYLAMLDGPDVLAIPGLPPTPYRAAPCEVWQARGLHVRAWAAWWGAVARQRAMASVDATSKTYRYGENDSMHGLTATGRIAD